MAIPVRVANVLVTIGVVALATATAVALTTGIAAAGGPSPVVHRVGSAARSATTNYWTPSREASATQIGSSVPAPSEQSSGQPSPPPGTPDPTYFDGARTVGALFFTTGGHNHFCTASVVEGWAGDTVLTAAHCVAYGRGNFAQNVVYVPQYHNGIAPYGAWPVKTITVTSAWESSGDIDDDFAFLAVSPPAGTTRDIQSVTGGLWLGLDRPYNIKPAWVIGYNNTDDQPIICPTQSFEFTPTQIEFYCNNYNDGTSGGPWIANYNPRTGGGTVYGDIGGFEQGGNYPWQSFSPYYSTTIGALFQQAQQAG